MSYSGVEGHSKKGRIVSAEGQFLRYGTVLGRIKPKFLRYAYICYALYIKAFGHNATFWEKKVIFKETGSYPKRFFGQHFFGRIGPCWGGGGGK